MEWKGVFRGETVNFRVQPLGRNRETTDFSGEVAISFRNLKNAGLGR